MTRKKSFDIVIAGSGLAGLAAAFFAAERGRAARGGSAPRVAVTDRAEGPGLEASARSASMICQLVRDPLVCRFMIRSGRLLKEVWLRRFPDVAFAPCGSLHIGLSADVDAFDAAVEAARAEGVEVERWDRAETVRRFPALDRTGFKEALWCPSDGVLDTGRLVRRLWQDAACRGTEFVFGATGRVKKSSHGFEAEGVPGEWLSSPVLVNAAGAWAGEVAKAAGASPLTVQPTRRHIFVTAKLEPQVDIPIVWDISREVYARPDGAAVMTSPCDEEPCQAGAPGRSGPVGPAEVSKEVGDILERKLKGFFPAALGPRQARVWSGLRTFSADRKFVIGRDPVQPNFFWAACLGGYGVTAAAACGDLAASLLLNRPADPAFTQAFSPSRPSLRPQPAPLTNQD